MSLSAVMTFSTNSATFIALLARGQSCFSVQRPHEDGGTFSACMAATPSYHHELRGSGSSGSQLRRHPIAQLQRIGAERSTRQGRDPCRVQGCHSVLRHPKLRVFWWKNFPATEEVSWDTFWGVFPKNIPSCALLHPHLLSEWPRVRKAPCQHSRWGQRAECDRSEDPCGVVRPAVGLHPGSEGLQALGGRAGSGGPVRSGRPAAPAAPAPGGRGDGGAHT